MALRALTWNLFHGRSVPGAGRSLLREFAAALASWPWDVALLQEVPPWWPRELAAATGAAGHSVPTSRNQLLPLRRALAEAWPDLIKSGGGGANAILARGPIVGHRSLVLRRWPERRVLGWVRLGDGTCVANLHASGHRAGQPPKRAREEVELARRTALAWAAGDPLVLGGDLNLRLPELDGLVHVATRDVDHLFAAGLERAGPPRVLDRGALSDHPPLMVELRPAGRPATSGDSHPS